MSRPVDGLVGEVVIIIEKYDQMVLVTQCVIICKLLIKCIENYEV